MQEKILCHYRVDNCSSRNEFIIKALEFYIGYLETQNASKFLSDSVLQSIQGTLRTSETRIATNLFRLSVEMNMMMHLLGAAVEATDEQLLRLRNRSVDEVTKNKGKIQVEDAVVAQRTYRRENK